VRPERLGKLEKNSALTTTLPRAPYINMLMNNLECPKPNRLLDDEIQLSDMDRPIKFYNDDIPVTNTPFCREQDTVHNSSPLRYELEELIHTVSQCTSIIHPDRRSIETEA
jgi:hypothetical protein